MRNRTLAACCSQGQAGGPRIRSCQPLSQAGPAPRYSLEGKLALLLGPIAAVAVGAAVALFAWTGLAWLSALLALALSLPLGLYLLRRHARPVNRILQALADGIASLRDADFSVSIACDRRDELGALVRSYNELGRRLREERQSLFQRELLLETVIQASPVALVLTDDADHIIYSNAAARHLFNRGRRPEGHRFGGLLAGCAAPFAEAVGRGRDTLFTVSTGSEQEIYHLAQRRFVLNTRPHRLYLFKQLTRELARQEVATWKKVIRVIAHELNNSLAPMSSLAHSGRAIAGRPDGDRLAAIFSTIEERAAHLRSFIDGYARFAKLPQPRPERIDWSGFLRRLRETLRFGVDGQVPGRPGFFDPAQIEQVLINLLKNAHESGSPPEDIRLEIQDGAGAQRIHVLDRGPGMSETVLRSALLPFYSTKRSGSGLGLPLCREIVEAHGGRLTLANRPDGGLVVEFTLPEAGEAQRSVG